MRLRPRPVIFRSGRDAVLYQRRLSVPPFVPADLFGVNDRGAFLDVQLPEMIFRDNTGTAAAIIAGPVGLVRRMAGTADGRQNTSAMRPTYGRIPKGGQRRNIFLTSELFTAAAWAVTGFSPTNQIVDGVIRGTAIGSDMRYAGIYDRTNGAWIIPPFDYPAGNGRRSITFTAPAGCIEACVYAAMTPTQTKALYATPANSIVVPGQTYTASLHINGNAIGGVMLEVGPAMTRYQKVASAYDVTEETVPSVFYIADGSPDRALIVPVTAGTYTRAHVTSTGAVTIEEGLALTGNQDVLLSPTVAEVILISRALTGAEKTRLTGYWEGRYK